MRARTAAGLAATAALLAACGSTVQTSQSAVGLAPSGVASTPGTTSGDSGLTVPGTTTGGAVAGWGSTTATGTGTTGTGTGGTTATGSGTTSGTGTSSGSATGRSGEPAVSAPGITASTINLGFEYSTTTGAADRAVGVAGAAPSYDFRDVMNAAINYANKHGGFAGRKLQGIYYDLNVANPRESEDQAACAKFTEDNKVFAMQGQTDILRACAEKAGAVSLVSGNEIESTFHKYPHFVDPSAIRLDRMGPVTVGGLYKAGYFTGKLGLITWDEPNYRYAMTNGYLPALAAHGIKPAAPPAYIGVPQQVGAIGDMTAEVSSVVTKFRSLGIDHVIIQDGTAGVWAGGGITLEFMNNAKSQHYYPRYGENTYNLPGSSELPSDEQNNLLAILDADESAKNDAGWHMNAAREKCFKIQAEAGIPVSESNDNDESLAALACDVVFFLQQVINQLPVLSSDAFVSEVQKLGTSFKPAFVYGTRFFQGRLDGSDSVRTVHYYSSCQCLKFAGPPYQPD
jgi:hypothetical protein